MATILRETGLIVSVRSRNKVLHTLTPLGTDLLGANPHTAASLAFTGPP